MTSVTRWQLLGLLGCGFAHVIVENEPLNNDDVACRLQCPSLSDSHVCGTDGVTYNSTCDLNNAACDNDVIWVEYHGRCQSKIHYSSHCPLGYLPAPDPECSGDSCPELICSKDEYQSACPPGKNWLRSKFKCVDQEVCGGAYRRGCRRGYVCSDPEGKLCGPSGDAGIFCEGLCVEAPSETPYWTYWSVQPQLCGTVYFRYGKIESYLKRNPQWHIRQFANDFLRVFYSDVDQMWIVANVDTMLLAQSGEGGTTEQLLNLSTSAWRYPEGNVGELQLRGDPRELTMICVAGYSKQFVIGVERKNKWYYAMAYNNTQRVHAENNAKKVSKHAVNVVWLYNYHYKTIAAYGLTDKCLTAGKINGWVTTESCDKALKWETSGGQIVLVDHNDRCLAYWGSTYSLKDGFVTTSCENHGVNYITSITLLEKPKFNKGAESRSSSFRWDTSALPFSMG